MRAKNGRDAAAAPLFSVQMDQSVSGYTTLVGGLQNGQAL